MLSFEEKIEQTETLWIFHCKKFFTDKRGRVYPSKVFFICPASGRTDGLPVCGGSDPEQEQIWMTYAGDKGVN